MSIFCDQRKRRKLPLAINVITIWILHEWFSTQLALCFFKCPAWENNLPQESYLWSMFYWNCFGSEWLLSSQQMEQRIFFKPLILAYTFVILVAFMNCVNVCLQCSCLRKWFATRHTFVIFVAIMNCVDVVP